MELDTDKITGKELKESVLNLEDAIKSLIWEWESQNDLIVTEVVLSRDENMEIKGCKTPMIFPYELDS